MAQVGEELDSEDIFQICRKPPVDKKNEVCEKLGNLVAAMKIEAQTSRKLSLTDLNYRETFIQVTALEPNEVIKAIDDLDYVEVFESHGYFNIPSRDKRHSKYIKEYDQLLLTKNLFARSFRIPNTFHKALMTSFVLEVVKSALVGNYRLTKREIFYMDTELFEKQANSDSVIEDVACLVGCTRGSLNIVAAETGHVIGNLIFCKGQQSYDCTQQGTRGTSIPNDLKDVIFLPTTALFVLLVEKEATFMRLAEDNFYGDYPCIIITGEGQPDVATRQFLRKLKTELHLPILSLMDCDPHGFQIMTVYASGSIAMSYDSGNLTTPDVKWLGIRPSDLDKYNIPNEVRVQLTSREIKMIDRLLKEEFVTCKPKWVEELRLMRVMKQKVETQALHCFGIRYLTNVYLPQKLAEEDWL